jgi:hypothetical protein
VLEGRPHRRNQRFETVPLADLAHPLDHAPAQPLATMFGADHDLERTENARRRSSLREPGFEDCVDAAVGEARLVSIPCCGNRVPTADDLLTLVVPEVEAELGVLGNHPL